MHCGRSRFAQSEYGLSPEWHLTWTQSYRHPGAGRDPDAPMAVAFLDSGLRRNDDQCLRTGLSWLKFKYHSISPPLKTPSTRFPQEFQTAFGRSAVQDAKAGGWGEGICRAEFIRPYSHYRHWIEGWNPIVPRPHVSTDHRKSPFSCSWRSAGILPLSSSCSFTSIFPLRLFNKIFAQSTVYFGEA